MKKTLFLSMGVAVLLASCSNEEVIDLNPGNEIGFRATMNGSANSRSHETTTDNLNQFYVTAYNGENPYFSDLLFQKTDKEYFVSNPIYYWPNVKQMTFKAIGYASEGNISKDKMGTVNITHDNVTIDFTVNPDPAEQIDLVYAQLTANKSNNKAGHKLDFEHLLTRILVKANVIENSAFTFKIKAVEVAGFTDAATFDYSKGPLDPSKTFRDDRWSNTATEGTASYRIDFDEVTLTPEEVDLLDHTNAPIVVPQSWIRQWDIKTNNNVPHLRVLLQIIKNDTGEIIFPSTANDEVAQNETEYGWANFGLIGHYMGGCQYIISLGFGTGAGVNDKGETILGGPIVFKETVTDWTDKEQITLSVGTSTETTFGKVDNDVEAGEEPGE